jgi:hypothetical protein
MIQPMRCNPCHCGLVLLSRIRLAIRSMVTRIVNEENVAARIGSRKAKKIRQGLAPAAH